MRRTTRPWRIALWCLTPISFGLLFLLPRLPLSQGFATVLVRISPLLCGLCLLFPVAAMLLRTLENRRLNNPPEKFVLKMTFLILLALMLLALIIFQWIPM